MSGLGIVSQILHNGIPQLVAAHFVGHREKRLGLKPHSRKHQAIPHAFDVTSAHIRFEGFMAVAKSQKVIPGEVGDRDFRLLVPGGDYASSAPHDEKHQGYEDERCLLHGGRF